MEVVSSCVCENDEGSDSVGEYSPDGRDVRVVVEVEVALKPGCLAGEDTVRKVVGEYLMRSRTFLSEEVMRCFPADKWMSVNVEYLRVIPPPESPSCCLRDSELRLYPFLLDRDGAFEEFTEDGDEAVVACQQWQIPSVEFDGLWENLVFESKVKSELLAFAETAMLFADKEVDTNIISLNRVIL